MGRGHDLVQSDPCKVLGPVGLLPVNPIFDPVLIDHLPPHNWLLYLLRLYDPVRIDLLREVCSLHKASLYLMPARHPRFIVQFALAPPYNFALCIDLFCNLPDAVRSVIDCLDNLVEVIAVPILPVDIPSETLLNSVIEV